MDRKLINKIFEIFQKNNQLPETELKFNNNFTLAVAVILSAQATDVSVNKATEELFEKYNTAEKMLALGEENLKKYIKTIGLYNSKAKNIIALCQILVDKYDSQIPDDFKQLIALPGIGRKTANVILNCGFGKPTMAVDTHVYRVSRRLGLSQGKNPLQVEQDLVICIPDKWLKYAHHWLILHGRYICKARKPLCDKCPINNYCKYYKVTNNKN